MKNLKSLLAVSLTSLLMASTVSAAPAKDNAKSAVKTETVSTVSSISQAISINVESRQLTVDNDGQALAVFKYVLTNTGNKPISAIQWVSAYVNKREVVHSQDMQIDLQSPLMPGKSLTINLQIPFVQIQEKFRPVFMDSQAKIDVYPIDRIVTFDDKKVLQDSK